MNLYCMASSFFFVFILLISSVNAQEKHPHVMGFDVGHHGLSRADRHAPIGVIRDHMHHKGEWMFSYRFMHMEMKGSRDGGSSIGRDEIVTTVANLFFDQPMQPPILRVVPTQMTIDKIDG